MSLPPSDLIFLIAELKSEFQVLAATHPWICLYVPPLPAQGESLYLGVTTASPYASLSQRPGVLPPTLEQCAVVDYVQQLTFKAEHLLESVLTFDSLISPDIQQEIREWEKQRRGYGWIRWLWHVTVTRHVRRFENYPQKAAAGLWELKENCRQSESKDQTGKNIAHDCIPRADDIQVIATSGETEWKALLALVSDENPLAILSIRDDRKMNADQKMRSIYAIDNRVLGWDSSKWADVLKVSSAAVRKTDWWRSDRARLSR